VVCGLWFVVVVVVVAAAAAAVAAVVVAADMLSFLDLCCDRSGCYSFFGLRAAVSFFDDRKLPFCLLFVCDRSIDR